MKRVDRESGTVYFSLNTPAHWERRGISGNLELTDQGAQVRSGEKYGILDTIALETIENAGRITAFAVGPLGRLILLDELGDLWAYDRRSRHHERLFVQGHGLFAPDSLLAVSGDTLLVADGSGERSLSAFDLAGGQARWRRTGIELDGLAYLPLALAADERYVYVLTALDEEPFRETLAGGPPGEPCRLAVIRLTAASGAVDRVFADETFAAMPPPPGEDWRGKHDMAVSADGDVYVFDSVGCALYVIGAGGELITRMLLPSLPFAGLGVDSRRQLYIGDSRQLSEEGEDDRFILHFGAGGELIGRVAGYRGKTDALSIDAADRMYILNGEHRTITVMELEPQTLASVETGAPEAVWLSQAFDSTEAETVWHRFTLDADIPDGTQLRVRYFSSDSASLVLDGSLRDVDEWIRSEERSLPEKLAALAPYWSPPVVNPSDALFFGARGRYLWLLVEWVASERRSPRLRRLRVYFPRDTLLSYLPAVYQEEETSRDFMERYLSLFGTLFDSVDERIADVARYFDREVAEGARLRWLASWLGIDVDEHWDDEWVRRYIRAAPELYRYRGTRRGIELAVETFTGLSPIIVEPFQFKAMQSSGDLKWLTDRLYSDDPFTFTVLLHPSQAPTDKERVLLRQLIDDQKPAHTEARIVWLQPWMYLDLHTYLGMNTMLAEPSLLTLHPDRSMPNDTLIVDMDMDRRLDAHTRLELDSELE